MKREYITVLILIIFSIFLSCERKQQITSKIMTEGEIEQFVGGEIDQKEEIAQKEFDFLKQNQQVHIVGGSEGNAVYWLNGKMTVLPKEREDNAGAKAIAVSGSDVHIAGYEIKHFEGSYVRTDAVYWLNGIKIILPCEFTDPRPTAITVSGSNVHIVGRAGAEAVYWLNGVQILLPKTAPQGRSSFAWAMATGITISGSDVYIIGTDCDNAVYWLNGIEVVLPSSGKHPGAIATGIVISGSDVYIVGRDGLDAVYWRNEIRTVLYAGTESPYSIGTAEAVTVSDSNIYITGFAGSNIVYWLNWVMSKPLFFEPSYEKVNVRPNSIAVLDSDVFVVGEDGDDAVLWLNGNRIVLSDDSWASAIFVTR